MSFTIKKGQRELTEVAKTSQERKRRMKFIGIIPEKVRKQK